MSKPTVSVIVPVYRVEEYIEKCIQSLLDQTFTDFEAIIVDDGSPDNSITIAKQLVGGDPRFIFLEKENGGQGSARNLALAQANGQYIAFLDSDDYIDPLFLEKMLSQICAERADIVICGMRWVNESGDILEIRHESPERYYKKNDYCLIEDSIQSYLCNKIFKKNIFNNFRMNEHIIYEDEHLLFRLIFRHKIAIISEALYNYVQRKGSTVNSYNKLFIPSMKELVKIRKEFLIEHNIFDAEYFTKVYLHYICKTLQYLVSHSPQPIKETIKLKKELNKKYFNIKSITASSLSKNNKIKLLLLKAHPALAIGVNTLYRILHKTDNLK